jgi:hypothetical protein
MMHEVYTGSRKEDHAMYRQWQAPSHGRPLNIQWVSARKEIACMMTHTGDGRVF